MSKMIIHCCLKGHPSLRQQNVAVFLTSVLTALQRCSTCPAFSHFLKMSLKNTKVGKKVEVKVC
jgi:hypothetical protein